MKTSVKTDCVAIIAVAIAALVRWLLQPLFAEAVPFLTFTIAVIFAAWHGGLRSAFIATALGFLVALWLFVAPYYSQLDASIPLLARFSSFFIICFAIAVFGESMRRAQLQSMDAVQLAQQQAEALRITFASIEDAVITTDINERITFLNSVAQNLTGWSLDEGRGRPLLLVFNTDEILASSSNSSTGSSASLSDQGRHTVLTSRSRIRRIIDSSVSVIRNDQGKPVGKIAIFRDISARRQHEIDREQSRQQILVERTRNEMALRDSEARYRAIGEAIDFGVWMCDSLGRNTYASESFLKLIGMTQLESAEFGWNDVMHPDEVKQITQDWQECVRNGATWDRELRLKGVDGCWHHILARGVAMTSDEGQCLGWVGIHLDISRLKQAEESLREADRRKDEFLATLAHELRNPLAPMRNAIQILRMSDSDPTESRSAAKVMDRQIEQMTRLIDDLLDVSRISRNKLELRKANIDLHDVMTSALEASRPSIEEFGHELMIELPSESLVLNADLTRLSQVVLNLLNNAAKYTERGGRIELRAQRCREEVVVSVKDNGIGIPPHKQPFLFQMFAQLEDSISRSQGGLGIGLALVKRLVEMHSGSIEVFSEGLGQGSTFTVRLPLVADGTNPERINNLENLETEPSSHRILVVDDNQDAANTLTTILQLKGNNVRTVHDGEQAVIAADDFQPDIILLDIGLPGMNGYEVATAVRQRSWSSKTTLIAVTGWGQADDKRRAVEAGFDKHLVKPVDPRTLLRILAELPSPRQDRPV